MNLNATWVKPSVENDYDREHHPRITPYDIYQSNLVINAVCGGWLLRRADYTTR